MKLSIVKLMILSLALGFITTSSRAAEVAGVELMVAEDTVIALEDEKLIFDFTEADKTEVGDELNAKVSATYVLNNPSHEEAYTAVALVKTIKVKEVSVKAEDKRSFLSGEFLQTSGGNVKGYIYPIGAPEKLYTSLSYKSYADMLLNMDYSGYLAEAFSRYGILNLSQYNKYMTDFGIEDIDSGDEIYYVLSDEGEERLCVVVYNLSFGGLENKTISVEKELAGVMTRPNKNTTAGTCFTYSYSGRGLKNFYTVGSTEIVFNMPEKKELGFVNSDAPYYNNDGVITARYMGGFDNFTFKIGEELSKDRINLLWGQYGGGKVFLDVVQVVITALLGVSVIYIVYSVRNRKQSGIGADKKSY